MKNIPNLFTLLNLLFGCIAIVYTLQNGIVITADAEGALLLDNASSEMGKQLDSLADVVSFGVAPGIIIYQFLRLSFAQEEGGVNTSVLWLLPAFVLPCAAAWRLAKFNLDNSQSFSFKGMPVPAVGIFVASLPLIYWNVNEATIQELLLNKWFLYAVVAVLSWLMVSNLPLMALKFKDYSIKNRMCYTIKSNAYTIHMFYLFILYKSILWLA